MRLYLCHLCETEDHAKCERSTPCPPGHFGGSRCTCPCQGHQNWRERQEKEHKAWFKKRMKLLDKLDSRRS